MWDLMVLNLLIGKKKGLTWGCKEISIEKNL